MRITLAVVAALAACGGHATTTTTPPPLTPPVVEEPAVDDQHPATPKKLAQLVDPGPLPAALDATPSGVQSILTDVVGPPPEDPGASMAQLSEALATIHGQITLDSVGPLVGLIAMTVAYEDRVRDTCPLACLALLENAYRIIDIPMLADESNVMTKSLATSLVGAIGQVNADRVVAALHWAITRAPLRHRQIVTRMLREFPDAAETTDGVRRVAVAAVSDENFELARIARQYVVARPNPTAQDHADLARTCFQSLHMACGTAERAAATGADADTLKSLDETAKNAALAETRAGAATFDDKLALASAYVELGRLKDAVTLLTELKTSTPKDARPLVGLADIALRRVLGNPEARVLLEQASKLDHRGRDFYELYLGTLFVDVLDLFSQVGANGSEAQVIAFMTSRLQPMSDAVEGLAQFDAGRAAVLRVMIKGAIELATVVALPEGADRDKRQAQATTTIWKAALETRTAFPHERDAHLLVILLTHFRPTGWDELEKQITTDIPADLKDRDQVLIARATAMFHYALSSGRVDRYATLEKWLAELPLTNADGKGIAWDLRTDAIVLEAAAKHATWADVARKYKALAEESVPADMPDETETARTARLENNLAVALYRSGDRNFANDAWNRAAAALPDSDAVHLNRDVLDEKPSAEAIADLKGLAEKGEAAGLRFQAALWLRAFAIKGGEKKQPTIAALKAQYLSGDASLQLDGHDGLVSQGSFQVGLGYSTTERLVLNLHVKTTTYLVIPAPMK